MRKPSQATINLYNRLVENQNKVRKQLRKLHKSMEESSGAGRLPALVIPKQARKIRNNYFNGLSPAELQRRLKAFYGRLEESKRLFANGMRTYLARIIKDGYIELWRDQILFTSGEMPTGAFGKYSKEQQEGSYMGAFMEVFNLLQGFSPEFFLALLYTGKIIQFKYIYQDIIQGTGEKENSWLQQQKELLEIYKSPKARYQLLKSLENKLPANEFAIFKDAMEKLEAKNVPDRNKKDYAEEAETGEAKSYSGRHRKSTEAKAQEAFNKAKNAK